MLPAVVRCGVIPGSFNSVFPHYCILYLCVLASALWSSSSGVSACFRVVWALVFLFSFCFPRRAHF